MDGLEMTQKLHSRLPEVPVVLMSGTFEAEKQPLPAGVTAFLTKPFRLEQLLSVIAQALQQNR
jgi:CheY-like chemotaxis protein